ncbi:MAG: sulfurtransferase [Anaerolineae bacterium]
MHAKILFTAEEVAQLYAQPDVVLVDVRSPDYYRDGHIPGAVNIPELFTYLAESSPEGLAAFHREFEGHFSRAGITPEKTVILYEDYLDNYYGSSCRGYWIFCYLGHRRAGILDRGYAAWLLAGHPVSTTPPQPTPAKFIARPQPQLMMTKADMLQAIADPSVKLLDDRDAAEWRGHSSSPYGVDFAPRKGRISGATWIEWYHFMDRSRPLVTFKSPEQIRALCARHNLFPDDDIVIYCFKGARGSNTCVALKLAGFERVRLYFASWNEWSRDPALPIEAGAL